MATPLPGPLGVPSSMLRKREAWPRLPAMTWAVKEARMPPVGAS